LILSRKCYKMTSNFSTKRLKSRLKLQFGCHVKHPAIREPASGCSSLYSERSAIKPGISASASSISFLPRPLENIFYFESHKRHSCTHL
jgi:hypothetical protein